jgi:hypothetical protein
MNCDAGVVQDGCETGLIGIGRWCWVSLAASVVFGPVADACAAKFLAQIAELLQKPQQLV